MVLRLVINKDLMPFRKIVQIFENVNFDAYAGYLIENGKNTLCDGRIMLVVNPHDRRPDPAAQDFSVSK